MGRKEFLGPATVVGAFTLLSRVLGMLRDVAFAYIFGAGQAWDAFVIAFAVPNMLRHLFGEGALTSAFLPVFIGRLEHSTSSARTLLRALTGSMLAGLTVVTVAAVGVTYLVERWFDDPKFDLILGTLRITLAYGPLICLTAVLGAALNGLRHFAAPAFAPVILNVVMIAAAFLAPPANGEAGRLQFLAWAVVAGGVAQLGSQLPGLRARGMSPIPSGRWKGAGLGEVLRGFLPAVAGLAVIQINEVFDNVIAELFVAGDGAVSAIYYANRLNQLPMAVIGFSLATAAFPAMSRHAARGEHGDFAASLRRALGLVFFLAIPAAAGLAALSHEASRLLFERGEFGGEATRRTAWVLTCFSIGLPFYAANMVLTRGFYSLRDMSTPVRVSLATVGLNLALNVALVFPFAEGGIALATSTTGILNFALLVRALRGRVGLPLGALAMEGACAAAAAAAMAGLIAGLRQAWPAPESPWALAGWTGAVVAAGASVYFGIALALRRWRRPR
jgi:putative peptidoglycan lipid II flippase